VLCSSVLNIAGTFATGGVGVGRGRGHLQGQAVGALEGVAVPDEEASWFLVPQHGDG